MEISWSLILMQVIFGLSIGAIYVLLAGGLSIILGLLDVVNFAHGIFYMLGAYALYAVISLCGNFWIGVVSAVIVVSLIGGLTERLLLKPLYPKGIFYPLFLTFGLSVCVPDIIKIFFGLTGKVIDYPSGFMGAFMVGSIMIPKYRLFVFMVTIAIFFCLWLFFKKSNLGMIIRAATRDSLMVEILGINVSRVWTYGFMLGIGMASLAGALSAPMVSATPYMGAEMLIDSFVVVVIGGFGSLAGAMLGGLLIGQIVSFVSLFAPAYSHASIFFVMAIVLIFRPRGLLGEEGRL